MEKAKKRKLSIRAGLILALAWLFVAYFVMSVSAATSGEGSTSNNAFTWFWETDNTNDNAAGSFSGKSESMPTEEHPDLMTLSVEISADSSTFKEGSCGGSDTPAASTKNTAIITYSSDSTIRIISVKSTTATCSLKENDQLVNGTKFYVEITADPDDDNDSTPNYKSGSVVITYIVVANVNVTYYGADGASYTYDGVSLTNATAFKTVEAAAGSSITLPAEPTITNGTFVGWRMSHDGSLNDAGSTVTVAKETSIYPVVKQDGLVAPFTVSGKSYEFWTDAAMAAGSSGTIILNQDYTLPATMAGNGVSPDGSPYVTGTNGNVNLIVPRGVTLLIPFDIDNTVYKCSANSMGNVTEPACVDSYSAVTAFLTLTMGTGTHVTVNGDMSVSGKHCYAAGPTGKDCTPSGPQGMVKMEDGSSITVNGTLYAWGYIYGGGSVTVSSTGTVYELMQLLDFRGGTATKDLGDTNKKYKVFPFSQFYVQNVEVPMTYHSGAKEIVMLTIYGGGTAFGATVSFLGSSGSLFTIGNDATVTKRYDGSVDRTIVDLNGTASIQSIAIDIPSWASILVGFSSINSSNFVLALSNNFTININSGTTSVNQDVALLPGVQMNIAEGATVTLGSGKSVYIYDGDQWGNYVHKGDTTVTTHMPIKYSPTKEYTRTAADLVDSAICVNGTLNTSAGYLYTTANGANIYSTDSGQVIMNSVTASVTYQYTQNDTTYHNIVVNSAWLKNGDSSYVQTSAGTYTYCSDCMKWLCDEHGHDVNHATNVELGNGLNMYFAFWDAKNPNKNWDGCYVEIIHTDASGNEQTTTLRKDRWLQTTVDTHDAWVVYYKNLSAKQMGDVITVKLYQDMGKDESGNDLDDLVVDTWSNSIRHYATRMLSKHSDNQTLCTLIVDMLNYGAACQTEFKYNTDNLVNAGLSAEQKSCATKDVMLNTTSNENSNYQANLIVDGNIQFAISGVDSQSSYAFKSHWGVTRDGQEFKPAGDYYYISKLYVADARQEITITVGGTTFTDSIESYCKRMIANGKDTNGVFTAFMKFSDAAYSYLHNVNGEGRV